MIHVSASVSIFLWKIRPLGRSFLLLHRSAQAIACTVNSVDARMHVRRVAAPGNGWWSSPDLRIFSLYFQQPGGCLIYHIVKLIYQFSKHS